MTELERHLREAAAETRALAASSIDVEEDLMATLQLSRSRSIARPAERIETVPTHRSYLLGGTAAALVVLLIGVLVVVQRQDDGQDQLVTAEPDPTLSPSSIPESVEESLPVVPLESVPSTASPSTADPVADVEVPPLPAQPVMVPVSYLDPPPTYSPEPFATIELDGDGSPIADTAQFAVGDGTIVVIRDGAVVTLVDTETGATTTRQLAEPISQPVLGPGNVLYGLAFFEPTDPDVAVPDAAIVAQPLDADPITVVDSATVDAVQYVELPMASFGLGPDGVHDRERGGGKFLDFVDEGGDVGSIVQDIKLVESDISRPLIRAIDGSAQWLVPVEEDPNAASSFVGDAPPAPAPNGGARLWTFIGPRLETEPVDFGTPTLEVVADLRPGAGQWWSLPDDWSVVASDVWGTLLVRDNGAQVDLAWFEPDPPPPLPVVANSILATDDDGFVVIARDDRGEQSVSAASDRIGWPQGCSIDALRALFAEAPDGSVLERVGCDMTLDPIAAGEFSGSGVRFDVALVLTESGWSNQADERVQVRLSNLRTVPIVAEGDVASGDTLPVTVTQLPGAPPLFNIAAAASSPEEFGEEIIRLLGEATAGAAPAEASATVVPVYDAWLVVVTERGVSDDSIEGSIRYFWLKRDPDIDRLVVDRAMQSFDCVDSRGAADDGLSFCL